MMILIFGLVFFFVVHAVPMFPGVRRVLVERLGRPFYLALFSVDSALALGLIIWGYATAERMPWYEPVEGGRHLTMLLVLLAFILLVASAFKGHIRKRLRHPAPVAVMLWAVGHLLANGDSASVVLFAGMLLYGLANVLVSLGTRPRPDFVPRFAQDIFAVLIGVAIYAALLFLHPILIGVAVIDL